MATSDLYSLATLLAVLNVGRRPSWSEQVDEGSGDPAYDGPPSTSTSGVDCEDAPRSMVKVQMRRAVHHRSVYLTPGTFSAATTYTTEVDGTSVGSTGATLALLLADIASDINTDGTINQVVSASVVDLDGDGVDDSVLLVGLGADDYSVALSVAGGTGTYAGTGDPISATMRLYAVERGPDAPGRLAGEDAESGDPGAWTYVNGWEFSVNYRGLSDSCETAGVDRLYVELEDVAGHADDVGLTYTPHVWIGPCLRESDQ